MLGKIIEKNGRKIKFMEQGIESYIEADLADWVKDEYVKIGEAKISVQEGVCSFVKMIETQENTQDQRPEEQSNSNSIQSKSKEEFSENTDKYFGQFRRNEVVNIKGKNHVIYEGLLRLAHERGLRNFEIVEKFISQDMKTAWVQVRAHCQDGTFFDGIGSSTPENTGAMTQDHPVEMAHTRAKGRALRDFLNIGQAMAEEIKQ